MSNEEFYIRCAEIIGISYECSPFPYYKRTRWNNRNPGSGRYPGFGIIRKFGDQIHVSLRHTISHNKIYNSEKDVFTFLENMILLSHIDGD